MVDSSESEIGNETARDAQTNPPPRDEAARPSFPQEDAVDRSNTS